jgi:hypothetical protein
MIRFYVVQIQLGHMKLEDVPEKWQKKVEENL